MTTAVRSVEAEDAQPTPPTSRNPEVDAVDAGGHPSSRGNRSRGRGQGPRRRHHSLPRQLLRVFEAAPSRGFVQSGLALRMEPFEAPAAAMALQEDEDEPGNSGDRRAERRRRRLTGDPPRPLRLQGQWSSTLDLTHSHPQVDLQPQTQPPQLLDRPLFGSGIPEPLSSYERHVRRAIERHRRAGSAGQLRRYATLADLSDLEAAAAEVERRVNGWDDGSPSPPQTKKGGSMLFGVPRLLPPSLPPKPPPRPKVVSNPPRPQLIYLPLHQPQLQQPLAAATLGRIPPPRFSTFDSFEAIKRTIITESASTAATGTSVTVAEPASGSRLLEANRWLLEAADNAHVRTGAANGNGGAKSVARPRERWLAAPASASARVTLPPPVPLRRNRQRQQQPPPLAAPHLLRNPQALQNPPPHPPPHPRPHPQPHPPSYPLSAGSWSTYGYNGDVSGSSNGGGYRHSADGLIVSSRDGVFFERESVV